MKVKKIRQERAVDSRGFSRWVQPRMNKYHLVCCDCGLVHEMQFRISTGAVSKRDNGGQPAHVQFRLRRAPVYTARERKLMEVEVT